MNIPLEALCDQSDLVRERRDSVADAAQRDLLEYFAPPRTAASAPPLAADFPPTAGPDGAAATEDDSTIGDEGVTWHDWILAWPDDVHDDEVFHHQPESPDEIAVCDPGACATHSQVAVLDEASTADLRRLETSLGWLQSEVEACRLPPATPLPPIPGLPVVAPVIDRSTLDRTLHRAPPLPAWLREPPRVPLLAPPRRGRAAWPRAIKFLVACAVAAPLSYNFAVATSPLYKRFGEVAGVAPQDSRVSQPEPRDASAPAGEVLALAPERMVETPASLKSAGVEAPVRPSPELPVAPVSAVPAPAVPGQAAPAELPRAETPRIETAKTEIVTGPAATVVAEDKAPSSPAVSVPASAAAAPQDVKLLLDQGKQLFDVGDLIAARILFLRAANAGDAAAAVAMGATYDPVVLADRGVRGVAADLDKARKWYERAREMGSPEGPRRLEMLANR